MSDHFVDTHQRTGGEPAYSVVEVYRGWVTLRHRRSGILYLISPDGQKQGSSQTLAAIHVIRARAHKAWALKHQQS